MNHFDPNAYGPVFAPLLAIDRRRRLDEGVPDVGGRQALSALTVKSAFAHTAVANDDQAACCLAAVWLLHDYLDESHTISQGIETPNGSFWHGIMHRREGDFSNAKYWFRRVGRHPAYDAIGQRASELAAARQDVKAIGNLTSGGRLDPMAFVDLCQAVEGGRSDARELCLDLQQAEWEALFDHCYRVAVDS